MMSELGTLIRQGMPEERYELRWVDGRRAALHATFPLLHLPPGKLDEHLASEVSHVLDVSVGDLLGRAWTDLRELHAFRGPSGGHGEVTLAHHTIEGDYRPMLTVSVEPPPPPSWQIPLDLRLKLDVGGATLGVGEGKIRKVSLVDLKVEASLLWGNTELFSPVRTKPFPIGSIELRDGIPIP
ncbi:hypothetical protein [Labilithrix luteola]|uniref:hypothetical protein n=1 Tax=Labilithrix luteola TaxID=1391654 RepID=UPI001969A3CC|nr:hypothetical protein [Labilithrix luteola]